MTLEEKYQCAVDALKAIATYKTDPVWHPPEGFVSSGDAPSDMALVAIHVLDDLGEWR